MGIKDLWTILRPFGERKPLFELQNKTVAIDLSCWVCEAQTALDYNKTAQNYMYLRNLYFRTCYLLLLGVKPIYVLEGKAPTLKYKTIASRNALQFKGKKPKNENSKNTRKCKDRSHFNYTLKLCEEMLKYMGLVCIKGNGEAEAMCAYLNEHNFVDGCITQDSDCFAYGARIVYRNFSISQQGLYTANGGAIDEYNIEKLESNNGIGRNKIIAMALLCGSDYSDGVFGVGKDSVLKLFSEISEHEILERLRSWRHKSDFYENIEKQFQTGRKNRLTCFCVPTTDLNDCQRCNNKDRPVVVKNELNIRKKALEMVDFPNEELIDEYLNNKQEMIKDWSIFKWKKPDIHKFIEFTKKYLQWEEIYAFEKFLPIITRWELKKNDRNQDGVMATCDDILKPDFIKKIRNPKGTPSYEIIWNDYDIHKKLIPEEQLKDTETIKLLSTIEPQHLVETAYPNLVEKYQQTKIKAPKTTNRKRKTNTKANSLKTKDIKKDKQIRLSGYINNKNGRKSQFELDSSRFGDEDDLNVSDVVENILNYKQPKYIEENINKIRGNKENQHECSFFITSSTKRDLFEETFRRFYLSDSGSEDDSDFSE